jgi:hypothetical protein
MKSLSDTRTGPMLIANINRGDKMNTDLNVVERLSMASDLSQLTGRSFFHYADKKYGVM